MILSIYNAYYKDLQIFENGGKNSFFPLVLMYAKNKTC